MFIVQQNFSKKFSAYYQVAKVRKILLQLQVQISLFSTSRPYDSNFSKKCTVVRIREISSGGTMKIIFDIEPPLLINSLKCLLYKLSRRQADYKWPLKTLELLVSLALIIIFSYTSRNWCPQNIDVYSSQSTAKKIKTLTSLTRNCRVF